MKIVTLPRKFTFPISRTNSEVGNFLNVTVHLPYIYMNSQPSWHLQFSSSKKSDWLVKFTVKNQIRHNSLLLFKYKCAFRVEKKQNTNLKKGQLDYYKVPFDIIEEKMVNRDFQVKLSCSVISFPRSSTFFD